MYPPLALSFIVIRDDTTRSYNIIFIEVLKSCHPYYCFFFVYIFQFDMEAEDEEIPYDKSIEKEDKVKDFSEDDDDIFDDVFLEKGAEHKHQSVILSIEKRRDSIYLNR